MTGLDHESEEREVSGAEELRRQVEECLPRLCAILLRHTGHDFSRYKQSTLVRRVRRRMAEAGTGSAALYLERLAEEPAQVDRLFQDLLIGVTHFFRDPEAFAVLESRVIPELLTGRKSGDQVRVWVPGCSTGEEAYSLAMLLLEQAGTLDRPPHLQVFATDIDGQALNTARQGWYGEGIAEQVAPERLARFFTRRGDLYQVASEVREICLFSLHDLITDPPFSRLDLISCRNVLIYLEPGLQKKLIPLCHYALRPGGFLFLGPSENVASFPELFQAVDERLRIFEAREVSQRRLIAFPLAERSPFSDRLGRVRRPDRTPSEAPAAVVQRLQTELHGTRDDLHAALEELESANEELLSANEELQVSKQELQSVNEELETINAELQKKIEDLQRAEQHRARLAAIVESSHDAIIGKTLEGTVTSWNAGAERLYGYTAEEAVGRNITFLAPPEKIGELGPIFDRLRRGQRVEPFETVRLRKDGTRLDIMLVVSPVFDSRGRIVEASAIAHDVTAQKRTEAALHEAARRKDEFLAMLGHELRNPLAPIRNSLEILEQPVATPEQAKRARRTLDRQVRHLSRLVDDLLDISRISQGRIFLRTGRLDLAALVRAAAEDHRASIAEAGQSLELDIPDRPLWVTGDPTRLAQCVGNVLHNAVKFSERGGRIVVAVRSEDGQAAASVQDTGMGMAPETLARLFEPFSQADSGIDRSRGGLGLGLALVKRLVEMHGGTVAAQSAGPGQGTRVELRIPLEGEAPAPAPEPDREDRRRARRCLLIEDNADAAETLGLLLELYGHDVRIARDGREGLETARGFLPEVVLCDIGLPNGLDGYEVARRMRQDPALRGASLVALSGYGQEEDQRRAREAGFDVHLTKPADPERLERLLAELP